MLPSSMSITELVSGLLLEIGIWPCVIMPKSSSSVIKGGFHRGTAPLAAPLAALTGVPYSDRLVGLITPDMPLMELIAG